ncbi:glycine zipper 2TM domain-containing protein [Chromobacterium piscinae]|uniref:glycine zipper 2TM domain-containing protein n=1 Tax=Chromobacterium piscinae TaxID=686831 RepID=UPI001E3CE14F|nr:glycine zipper 2TM domain-containing protein [Chromobacterium piscinae]MCD5327060.1 glycine zipper 2TM domain-containing protein [Chromobacterium piscinae]
MKQSVLIASVLGGGIALGAVGVAGIQAMKSSKPETAIVASAPLAQASAPAIQALAPSAASSTLAQPAPQASTPVAAAAPQPKPAPKPVHATHAKILGVTPIREAGTEPKQVCHQEQVVHQAPVQDENRIAGSVLGGVVGGLLGNQVGGGNGKKAATVIGALAGGYAGNRVQEGMQQRDQVTGTRTICNTEETKTEKIVGYNVRYSLDGKTGTVRMDEKPKGKTLPAKDGKLLI